MSENQKEIWLGKENEFKEFTTFKDEQIDTIPNISDVNLVLGRNNSRKSRFLRTLLLKESYLVYNSIVSTLKAGILDEVDKIDQLYISNNVLWRLVDTSTFFKHKSSGLLKKYELDNSDVGQFDLTRFKSLINKSISVLYTKPDIVYQTEVEYLLNYIKFQLELFKNQGVNIRNHAVMKSVADGLARIIPLVEELVEKLRPVCSPKRIYIPALRMTRNVFDKSHENKEILKSDLQLKYDIVESGKLQIYDGLDFYNRVLKLRNSIREKRSRIEEFEKFISETFFDNKQVDLVADIEEKNIRLFIEGDEDRLLYNLGDGVQNILMLLYPIFTCENQSWIFIEEPELNMHPGMQSLFIRTILSHKVIQKKSLRFFIVTHSNHLLDVGVDTNRVSFYTLTNSGKTSILTNQLSPNNNVLRELGVFNSSVVMSNCSIWVEGVSDRLFIKGFLKVYFDKFPKQALVEGYNYSFLEYAGNNLAHYDFTDEVETRNIKSFLLTNRIFLLADHDNGKESKHSKFEELSDNKDFVYETTVSKEIENLVPPKLLKLFLVEKLKANEERVKNYKFRYEDYSDIGFGAYLENIAVELKIKRKTYTQKNSNTGALSPHYKQVLSQFIFDKSTEGKVSWEDIIENGNTEKVMNSLVKFLEMHN